MAAQAHDFFAPRHVPQPDRAVASGCRQTRAIGVEGNSIDHVRVSTQHPAFTAVDLPEANGVIFTARGKTAAVGTESSLEDSVLVTAELSDGLVRPGIQ